VSAVLGDVVPAGKRATIIDEDAPHAPVSGLRLLLLRTLLIVGLLVVWELLSHVVDVFFISRPTAIAVRLWQWTVDGTLLFNTVITLEAALWGLIIGAVGGIVVGFALGQNRTLGAVADPLIVALYSLPKVALAPLFILWFGIGLQSKIALAAITVFFLVFFNTYAGVREVDQDLVDVLRIMGAGRADILRRVVLPSALGWIFVGLKVAVPYALIGAVVGEIVASNRGLGYLVQHSAGQFDSTGVFAALFVLMIIATALNELLNRAQGRLMRWKVTNER
jgi:NitT/TauT family transport system permease protein